MARTKRMAAYGLVIAAFLFTLGIVAAPLVPQVWPSIGAVVATQKPPVAVIRRG